MSDKPALEGDLRKLSACDAMHLKAGTGHYRAYVGPPKRFDFLSASQFGLLFMLGLNERHKVLDFGCGSLRLGRLLIPFLQEKGYYGIEPNKWLIDDGFEYELGHDALGLKQPQFAYNDDFDCTVFDTQFDFIIAQSILTHAGPDLAKLFLASARKALGDQGVFLASLKLGQHPKLEAPGPGWHYPYNIQYSKALIGELLTESGLHWKEIAWFHPGASWIVAARDEAQAQAICDHPGLCARPLGM